MPVGQGMRTWADGRKLLLVSPSLLRAVDGTLVGLISLRDEVRPEAAATPPPAGVFGPCSYCG